MEPRIDLLSNELGARISKRMLNVSLAIDQSPLPKATQALMALRASQINGCGWCIDAHTKEAAAAGETQVRLNLVAAWRHATVFTEAEQAALALTEEGTRLADANAGVSDETWAQVRALRRRPDRRAGLAGRDDQRHQPARRDLELPGRRRPVELIGPRGPGPDQPIRARLSPAAGQREDLRPASAEDRHPARRSPARGWGTDSGAMRPGLARRPVHNRLQHLRYPR